MARYYTAPHRSRADQDDWFDAPLVPDIQVPEHRPVDTGLVDIRGDAIMRAPNPMGFGRDGEW